MSGAVFDTIRLLEKAHIAFDIKRIISGSLEELEVQTRSADRSKHYTEITLTHLHSKAPGGRTLGKIREHLAGIYRMFTRDGTLELSLNDDPLTYEVPSILKVPYHKSPTGKPVLWTKEVQFTLGSGRSVTGFAALREKGSTSEAGFALFRRRNQHANTCDA